MWSLPSIFPAGLEKKIFIGFGVNPRWLPNHVTYDIMCEPFVPHGWAVIHVKFRLDLFSYFREDFFLTIWLPNHATDDVIIFFSVDHFIPRWSSKIFILLRCSVLHMQLWHHHEGTDDLIKKTSHSFPMRSLCSVSSFNCFFLRNCLSDWDEILTIGATTHVECLNHNYDVIGHMVWQSCWKNGKNLDLYLWNCTKEKN